MTVYPVKFRSFWHPLRGAGKIELKLNGGGGPKNQVYAIEWSGFPRHGLATIEVIASYPGNIRQRIPFNVEGADRGTYSVVFPLGRDDQPPRIVFMGFNRRGGTVFISEIPGGKSRDTQYA